MQHNLSAWLDRVVRFMVSQPLLGEGEREVELTLMLGSYAPTIEMASSRRDRLAHFRSCAERRLEEREYHSWVRGLTDARSESDGPPVVRDIGNRLFTQAFRYPRRS